MKKKFNASTLTLVLSLAVLATLGLAVINFPSNNANSTTPISNKATNLEQMRLTTREQLARISQELQLHYTSNPLEQLRQAIKVLQYICAHNIYDISTMAAKHNAAGLKAMMDTDLYYAVVEQRGNCTSFSQELQALLQPLGIDCQLIALTSLGDDGVHMSTLVKIGPDYYFFDPTLEQWLHQQFAVDEGRTVDFSDPKEWQRYYAVGLGQETYGKLYRLEVIITNISMLNM